MGADVILCSVPDRANLEVGLLEASKGLFRPDLGLLRHETPRDHGPGLSRESTAESTMTAPASWASSRALAASWSVAAGDLVDGLHGAGIEGDCGGAGEVVHEVGAKELRDGEYPLGGAHSFSSFRKLPGVLVSCAPRPVAPLAGAGCCRAYVACRRPVATIRWQQTNERGRSLSDEC